MASRVAVIAGVFLSRYAAAQDFRPGRRRPPANNPAASEAAPGPFAAFDPPSPPPLQPGPLLERWLFESPWIPMAFLLAIGLTLAWGLRRRGTPAASRHAAIALVATVLASAGIFSLAAGIETDREHLQSLTRGVVRATAAGDTQTLGDLLAPECILDTAIPGIAPAMTKVAILDRVAQEFGPRSHNGVTRPVLLEIQSSTDNPTFGRAQIKLRVSSDAWNFPIVSWWRMDWRKQPDGAWRATGIQLVSMPGT